MTVVHCYGVHRLDMNMLNDELLPPELAEYLVDFSMNALTILIINALTILIHMCVYMPCIFTAEHLHLCIRILILIYIYIHIIARTYVII